jgi:hypothetical protein
MTCVLLLWSSNSSIIVLFYNMCLVDWWLVQRFHVQFSLDDRLYRAPDCTYKFNYIKIDSYVVTHI